MPGVPRCGTRPRPGGGNKVARKNRLNPHNRTVAIANEQELRYLDCTRSKHIVFRGQVTSTGSGNSELYRWLRNAEALVDEIVAPAKLKTPTAFAMRQPCPVAMPEVSPTGAANTGANKPA